MNHLEIYTTPTCPYCHRAKALLDARGVQYTEYPVADDSARFQEMVGRSGGHTVPQIFIDGEAIGGSDELVRLEGRGELDRLLSNAHNRADNLV